MVVVANKRPRNALKGAAQRKGKQDSDACKMAAVYINMGGIACTTATVCSKQGSATRTMATVCSKQGSYS